MRVSVGAVGRHGRLNVRVEQQVDLCSLCALDLIENQHDIVLLVEDQRTLPSLEVLAGIGVGRVHLRVGETRQRFELGDLAADTLFPGLVFAFGDDLLLAVHEHYVVAEAADV